MLSLRPSPSLCLCLLVVELSVLPVCPAPACFGPLVAGRVILPPCLLPSPAPETWGPPGALGAAPGTGFSPPRHPFQPVPPLPRLKGSVGRAFTWLYIPSPASQSPAGRVGGGLSHLGYAPSSCGPGGVPGRASCRWLRARLLRDAFRSLRERLSMLCVHRQLPLAALEEEI